MRLLRRVVGCLVLGCGALPMVAAPQTADVAAGQRKAAQTCAVCHGPMGLATAPDAPHLAGQPSQYLIDQLKAYRGGVRQHPVMSVIAKTLSDQDLADLAGWFASIRLEVQSR